ncbi:MAG: DASH family cryptochrome [Tannerellaceae bacterium]
MRSIYWFRTDLRLLDNNVFKTAAESNRLLPVFILNPAEWERIGTRRRRFIRETIKDLSNDIKANGGVLYLFKGDPVALLPQIARLYVCDSLWAERLFCIEEVTQEKKLSESDAFEVTHFIWDRLLYSAYEMPFELSVVYKQFTPYRKMVEKRCKVAPCVEAPKQVDWINDENFDLPHYGLEPIDIDDDNVWMISSEDNDERSDFMYEGGTEAALQRLRYYLWEIHAASTYKETRNAMEGADYSTRMSAWLSVGALSPRMIYHELKAYEDQFGANESTYWIVFEMMWRDYFSLVALQQGNRFFAKNGYRTTTPIWLDDSDKINAWRHGKTDDELINALMHQLNATGYMGNRGRQIVASYLTKNMKQDWRHGAAWFEKQLIDYDPASNWGNWAYQAGVGNDPMIGRTFNTHIQTEKFDPEHLFINKWRKA